MGWLDNNSIPMKIHPLWSYSVSCGYDPRLP